MIKTTWTFETGNGIVFTKTGRAPRGEWYTHAGKMTVAPSGAILLNGRSVNGFQAHRLIYHNAHIGMSGKQVVLRNKALGTEQMADYVRGLSASNKFVWLGNSRSNETIDVLIPYNLEQESIGKYLRVLNDDVESSPYFLDSEGWIKTTHGWVQW